MGGPRMSQPTLGRFHGARFVPHACGLLTALGLMRIYGASLAHRSLRSTQLVDLVGHLATTATPEEHARWTGTLEGHAARSSGFGAAGLVLGLVSIYVALAVVTQVDRDCARLRGLALANMAFGVASFVVERADAFERTLLFRALLMRSGDGPSGVDDFRLLAYVVPAPTLTVGQLAMSLAVFAVAVLALAEKKEVARDAS